MSTKVGILSTEEKQPGETLDWPVDFTPWSTGRTDLPASATVDVSGPDSLLTVEAYAIVDWVVWVVLKGGTAKGKYKITIRLSTDAVPAIVKEADFYMKVKEA